MNKNFLQTKEWAEFQKAYGRQVFWIGDKLVVKFNLPMNKSWLYAPRVELKTSDQEFFIELSKLAKKENAIFAKVEQNLNNACLPVGKESGIMNNELRIKNHNSSFIIRNSKTLQPQDEFVINITAGNDELLAKMHPKTRYNINLAQKKNLELKVSHDPKDVEKFYNLALKTSVRDGFKYHSKNYYQKMMEILSKSKEVKVELVTCCMLHDNIPLASAILLYHNETCYYLHGASDHDFRQLMAPYFMQWQAILRAKKLGYKFYNFGGITPQTNADLNKDLRGINQSANLKIKNLPACSSSLSDLGVEDRKAWNFEFDQNHPWAGITRFKTGFCNKPSEGNFLHYPDCYDIVYQLGWYLVYQFSKKIKKLT